MTKKEFIEKLATRAGLTKKDAGNFTDAFIEELSDMFKEGEEVSFIGFGKFSVKDRAERKGKNPKTGETVIIPAYRAACFSASKALKDKINE